MIIPTHNPKTRRSMAGFSLLEMLVAIAVIGILASLAFPSFRQMLITQEVRSVSFDTLAALTFARSEAIKRNASVQLVAADASDWGKGWTVSVASSGAVLRQEPAAKGVSIAVTPAGTASIAFSGTGRAPLAANVSLQINDKAGSADVKPRCITLGLTGQPGTRMGAC